MNPFETSTSIREILCQFRDGNPDARDHLFELCMDRLRFLSHRLFQARKDLHLFEETDDLLQKTIIRLHKTVRDLKPESTRSFMALALQHVRWTLRDLARDLRKGKILPTKGTVEDNIVFAGLPESGPESLIDWEAFHQAASNLPDEEKEVFDAIFYGGATQEEAANILDISIRTVKRRWRAAKIMLDRHLNGEWPTLD